MKNFIAEFYKAIWAGGALGYPSHVILVMPSKHGKSLTTFRFETVKPEILINASDTTAESYRRKIVDFYSRGSVASIELIVLEDWAKVRTKVREPTAVEMAKFASGIYSLDQYNVQIKSTKVSCSTIINVPPLKLRNLEEELSNAGAGARYDIYEFALSSTLKDELDFLGFANQRKTLKPITLPDTSNEIVYEDFTKKFIEKYDTFREINLAYGCEYIEKDFGFFDEIKHMQRAKIIKEISWEDYWED